MTDDPGLQPVGYVPEESPVAEEPVVTKRPGSASRLAAISLVVLAAIAAAVYFVPSLREQLLPQARASRPAPAGSTPARTGPLPVVPVLWERIDLGAMPSAVARDLRSGKYYYDRRVPGNFGMAINYWKSALAHPGGADRELLETLVASAERELARQFSSDSGDAVILMKQGKRDQAIALLGRMRADYLDINAPQYVWASVMLSRRRR